MNGRGFQGGGATLAYLTLRSKGIVGYFVYLRRPVLELSTGCKIDIIYLINLIGGACIALNKNPLREVRERLGLSQRDMALLLGISAPSYCQAEKGHYRDITHLERKLKELKILKEGENIAEEYSKWREEKAEQLRKEVLHKIQN